jgi:hypothetical protein
VYRPTWVGNDADPESSLWNETTVTHPLRGWVRLVFYALLRVLQDVIDPFRLDFGMLETCAGFVVLVSLESVPWFFACNVAEGYHDSGSGKASARVVLAKNA